MSLEPLNSLFPAPTVYYKGIEELIGIQTDSLYYTYKYKPFFTLFFTNTKESIKRGKKLVSLYPYKKLENKHFYLMNFMLQIAK